MACNDDCGAQVAEACKLVGLAVPDAVGLVGLIAGAVVVAPAGTIATVNTNPTNLVAVVNGGSLELSWPADHIGWRLQCQSNSLATGLYTNWVDVPNTATVSSVTNAINAANGAVFYRMVYP